MWGVQKENFSYKLEIYLRPHWYSLYKRLINPKSEEEFEKLVNKRLEQSEKDSSSLWGRGYIFTEYYDSATGLTQRFQQTILEDGQSHFYPVDEFGDRGYIFKKDGQYDITSGQEEIEAHQRLTVEIKEDFIRNDIFDKYIGGQKADFQYQKENYLFQFPLSEIFNFLFNLGQRFHETERNIVTKWPDQIEKRLEELDIEYRTSFEYEPTKLGIEKEDKAFFEKWGKPEICLMESDRSNGYFECKENHNYSIALKLFRPEENERILTQK